MAGGLFRVLGGKGKVHRYQPPHDFLVEHKLFCFAHLRVIFNFFHNGINVSRHKFAQQIVSQHHSQLGFCCNLDLIAFTTNQIIGVPAALFVVPHHNIKCTLHGTGRDLYVFQCRQNIARNIVKFGRQRKIEISNLSQIFHFVGGHNLKFSAKRIKKLRHVFDFQRNFCFCHNLRIGRVVAIKGINTVWCSNPIVKQLKTEQLVNVPFDLFLLMCFQSFTSL